MPKVAKYIIRIREIYGVTVHMHYRRDEFFPAEWREAPALADGREIDIETVDCLLPSIVKFLSRYPADLVSKNLHSIYLLSHMTFFGLDYGGTNLENAIYATDSGGEQGPIGSRLPALLHHEFSSILSRRYEFPWSEWRGANPPGWRYFGHGREMLNRDDLFDGSEELLERGFLAVYSQASIEEDFNLYAEWLLDNPNHLFRAASRHERVRKKTELVVAFYKRLNVHIQGVSPIVRREPCQVLVFGTDHRIEVDFDHLGTGREKLPEE
jgi:hypothetical protein